MKKWKGKKERKKGERKKEEEISPNAEIEPTNLLFCRPPHHHRANWGLIASIVSITSRAYREGMQLIQWRNKVLLFLVTLSLGKC